MTRLTYRRLDEKVNLIAIKFKARGIVLELQFRNMLNKRFIAYNQAGPFYKLFAQAKELYDNEEWDELKDILSKIETKIEPYKKEFKHRL